MSADKEVKPKAVKPWKPALACDVDLDKVDWAAGMLVMCKVDGVRALNRTGRLVGRSLKEHKNAHITNLFSAPEYVGFDGELATGAWTDQDLCRKTSGNCSRKSAKEDYGVVWYIFDYIPDHLLDKPYIERLETVSELVTAMNVAGNTRVCVIPHFMVYSLEEFLALEEGFLRDGFEGAILRDPRQPYKSGRATVTMNNYLRLKRFIDFEGEVVEIVEAFENLNEKTTNELGRSERSSHQENMVKKGVVGMLRVRALADVKADNKVVIAKGDIIDVGPGNMLHEDRLKYFVDQSLLLGKTTKQKFFPKGMKDAPRFCTFISLRADEDMSE